MFSKRKVSVKIQAQPGDEWDEKDGHALYSFIHGKTGKKFMDNMRYTLYQEVLSLKKFNEWDDARRVALAGVISAMEELAEKPPE